MLMRLQYKTRREAERKAESLGLDGIHTHQKDGMTIYMPGRNHRNLNDALRKRGKEPTPIPGEGGGMGMMDNGSGMSSGSDMDTGSGFGIKTEVEDITKDVELGSSLEVGLFDQDNKDSIF
jgi:hypothetical protein